MALFARLTFALLAISVLAPVPLQAQAEEWTVYAAVVDRSGTPVTGLSAGDFVVRENGVAREILRVSPATDSLRVAVLIDTSQEMRNDLIDLRQGLRGFVNEMDRRHEISLMGFGGPPTVLVDYTRDLKRLETGISRLIARPGTGSYLLSAIIDTSRTLRKRRELRRVMVIITTQGPEFSEISYQTVLEYVKESGAPMHSYVLRREGVSPTDAAAQEVELTLAVGTQMTGGRREELLTANAMTPRLQSLASELNHQYQVVYARPKTLIPPKTLEFGVKSRRRRPGTARVLSALEHARGQGLRDRIAPGVRVLFVGINPGIRSAETGHHFAGYSNRFWKLLFESKLVPEPIDWRADGRLPEWGFGITNLVARETPGIDTLSRQECAAGIERAARQSTPVQAGDRRVCRRVALSMDFRRQRRRHPGTPARDVRRCGGVCATQTRAAGTPTSHTREMLAAFRKLRRRLRTR